MEFPAQTHVLADVTNTTRLAKRSLHRSKHLRNLSLIEKINSGPYAATTYWGNTVNLFIIAVEKAFLIYHLMRLA